MNATHRQPTLILAALWLGAAPPSGAQEARDFSIADGLRLAARYRVEAIDSRRFTHAEYWRAVRPATAGDALRVETVGRSIHEREIRSVTFGQGGTTVLLWSQMHGNESTATMALADIFAFLAAREAHPLRDRLRRALTVVFVPMLNPDGGELFRRENAVGIDVNRDARAMATPEARALKELRDRLRPDFGFNLHDQNARTRAGSDGPPAAIALLAPAYDEEKGYNEVRTRARLVAAGIVRDLEVEIRGRIARYDDTFNPRAFGDLMQRWGTSTVLIESGALPDDPEKQRLRALNVAAILGALDAIATRSFTRADPDAYEKLPRNAGGAVDLLVRGGRIVIPGRPPAEIAADVALTFDDAVARTGPRLREVGDLETVVALDTIDARGLYLHPRRGDLTRAGGRFWLSIGDPVRLEIRRGAGSSSPLVRRVE
ncbi:MAG TPA: M14 family zinc carboxypeptidase [Gemmatimonadales bacterium]|nr:M14 family zinc carboxypeptidase [Gemmatimonadales bacterium]